MYVFVVSLWHFLGVGLSQNINCPEECLGFPICTEDEIGGCVQYTNDGCIECDVGYFKKHWHYPCVSCSGTFGESCEVCEDFIGCQTCVSDKYVRAYDYGCDLWYCKTQGGDPTEQPTEEPSEEPTEPPTMKCTIDDTDLRLVFKSSFLTDNQDQVCYQYMLNIDNRSDLIVPSCQSNHTMIQWSLNFTCDDYSTNNNDYGMLSRYLESVFASTTAGRYEVLDDLFYFELPRSSAENNDIYTLCFNNELENNVGLFDESNYCVNVNLGKRRQACTKTIIPDICGESALTNSGLDDIIAEFPISYVPEPGATYDITDDETVNGTGYLTLREDLVVPRAWWVKECEKVDENHLRILFDDSYVTDPSIFDVGRPLMTPIYDRIVAPHGCRDIQGEIVDSYHDSNEKIYYVVIDKSVPELAYFNDSDLTLNELKSVEIDELAPKFERNDGEPTVRETEEVYRCVVEETDEEYIIDTVEDMEHIDNVIAPQVEAEGNTLYCFKESDTLETYIVNNLPANTNFTYDDFDDAVGSLNGSLAGNDTTRRRLVTNGKRNRNGNGNGNRNKNRKNKGATRRKLLINKQGSKTIAEVGVKASESVSKDGASCELKVGAGLKVILGYRLLVEVRVFPPKVKKFEVWGSIRAEGYAYGNLLCQIPNKNMQIKLWEKKYSKSKIRIFSIGPVSIHITPTLTLVARLDIQSPITWFNATARADAFAEFKIGFKDGKPFSTFDKGFTFTRKLDIDDENLDCNKVDINAAVVFEVNPGIEIGGAGLNLLGLQAIVHVPRLGIELDYPALNLCSADDLQCGAMHRRLYGVVSLYFNAYVPEFKILGIRITKRKTLFSSKNPVAQWTIFDNKKCIETGLLVDKLNDLCCEDETTATPTTAPTTTTTTTTTAAPEPTFSTTTTAPVVTPSPVVGSPTTPQPTTTSGGGSGSGSGNSVCVDTCSHEPCKCYENPSCKQCKCDDSTGCDECIDGYFQLSKNHRCISCRETFGDECLQCSNGIGCSQCQSGYKVTYDESCQLFYCQSTC